MKGLDWAFPSLSYYGSCRFIKVVIGIIILALLLVLFGKVGVFLLVFANEQSSEDGRLAKRPA